MAKFTPDGWSMSSAGVKRFSELGPRIECVVRQCARKYHRLYSVDADDLQQDGRLAAAYAVDTFEESRGSIMGYVSRVVYNVMAMVAGESMAQRRHPHVDAWDGDAQRWVKTPVPHSEITEIVDAIGLSTTNCSVTCTHAVEESLRSSMSADSWSVWLAKYRPNGELWVLARNINGCYRIDQRVLAAWLGWDSDRIQCAYAEMKRAIKRISRS